MSNINNSAFIYISSCGYTCSFLSDRFCLVVWQVPVKHFKKLWNCFSQGLCVPFYIPTCLTPTVLFLHIITNSWYGHFLSHQERGAAVSHDFSLHFPNDWWQWSFIHVYISIYRIYLFLVKYLLKTLSHKEKQKVSTVDYKRCLCILGIVPLSDICLNVFFQSVTCLPFLNCVFCCLTVLILMMSRLKILWIFVFWCHVYKLFCPIHRPLRFSPIFSSRSVVVLTHLFRCRIHF